MKIQINNGRENAEQFVDFFGLFSILKLRIAHNSGEIFTWLILQ